MASNGVPVKTLGVVSALLVTASIGYWGAKQLTAEPYPGPWQESPHPEISATLKSQSVPNCSRYKYRESAQNPSEYLVYCTADGATWTGYIVLAHLHKVAVGPFEPDPALE
ncbi:MAG TPA: hypothetical protein V6D06_10575 [Trichocoleus sp.]